MAGSIVFNGQSSVLWQNIRDAFKTELRNMYISLRSTLLFNYAHVYEMFEEHQSVWPERLWNEDAFNKYLQPYLVDNRNYLDMLQGDKSSQRDWWLYNAFKYRDSKYGTGDAKANRIILRGYIDGDPNDPADAEKIAQQIAAANITVTPYAHVYASVLFGSYSLSHRMDRNETYTFMNPMSYMNDTEIYIDSADQLSDVGDLSVLRLGKVADFSAATKLQRLVVGNSDSSYKNSYLQTLTVGNNELLTLVNVCNCEALANTIDLSGCTGIETVLASGSSITGVNLPVGGHLETIVLPATITNLTVRNQKNLTNVTIAGYSNLNTLRIENTPNIPIEGILSTATNLNRVRLVGVEWTATNETVLASCIDKLDTCIGMDVSGNNTDKAVVIGKVDISSISATLLERIQTDYPDLVVSVNGVSQYIIKFYNSDNTLLYSEVVPEGTDAVNPVTAGYISAPSRTNTDEIHYVFKDFGTLPTNVHANSSCVATYTESYRVRYLSDTGGSVLQSSYVTNGQSVQYNGSTPTKAQTAQYTYTFKNWSGADNSSNGKINSVTRARDVVATYTSTVRTYTVTFKNDDNSTVLQTINNVAYGTTPSYTGSTPTSTDSSMGEFQGWNPAIGPITGNTTYVATYESPVQDVEITGDWASIIDEIIYGTYSSNLKIGNYKALDLSSEGTPDMQIVAMDADVDTEGNTVPLTFVGKRAIKFDQKMNSSNSVGGGYPASGVKSYIDNVIYSNYLATNSENIKRYIKPVNKTSYGYSMTSNVFTELNSVEKLWIPSYREINGGTLYEKSGPVYTNIYNSYNSKRKYHVSGASETSYITWWLRSSSSTTGYWYISRDGTSSQVKANTERSLVLGFCLGPDTIHDTWEEISAHITAGDYSTVYSIGDTKAVDMGDQGVICFQIAAFNADVDENGNTIPITWVAQQILVTNKQMNTTGTNAGGYSASAMKTTVMGYYDRLPSTLKSMIVPVSKISRDYNGGSPQDLTSIEILWIPSYREIFGGSSYEQSGPVYSSLFSSSTTRIKKRYGTGSASSWWLRSANTTSSYNFRCVNSDGDSNRYGASSTDGVVVGFCTGAIPSESNS